MVNFTEQNFNIRRRGQMKIMQMSFMIIAVFIFFVLVGLFFFRISLSNLGKNAEQLQREDVISSLGVIAGLGEFSYSSDKNLAIDEDKLDVMVGDLENNYFDFWPVASIEFYKIYPSPEKLIKCPAENCNYYNIYDSGQSNIEKYSSYVSICKRVKEFGSVYDRCEVGKIVAGVKINED